MKKSSRILFLCSTALLLCTGCASAESPKDALMNYMSERYPEDHFTWSHNELGTAGRNTAETFEIILNSEKFPDAEIHAARWKTNGEFVYADNYMAYYLEDDVNAYMHDLAEECFGECKVYVYFSYGKMVSSAFPTDATAEDYLKSKPSCTFTVFMSPEHITMDDAKEGFQQFKTEYEKRQFDMVGAGVYILPDAESYEKTDSSCGPTNSSNDLKYYDFVGGISSLKK